MVELLEGVHEELPVGVDGRAVREAGRQAVYSRRFRKRELELLASVLEGYGLDPERWPAASIVLSLSGISRFMLIEQAFGVDVGHAETIAVIEREIQALEGERRA